MQRAGSLQNIEYASSNRGSPVGSFFASSKKDSSSSSDLTAKVFSQEMDLRIGTKTRNKHPSPHSRMSPFYSLMRSFCSPFFSLSSLKRRILISDLFLFQSFYIKKFLSV